MGFPILTQTLLHIYISNCKLLISTPTGIYLPCRCLDLVIDDVKL